MAELETARIKQWILDFLQNECSLNEYSPDLPLFQQIDSFQVVSFLLACEEEYRFVEQIGGGALTPLTVDEIVEFIRRNGQPKISS